MTVLKLPHPIDIPATIRAIEKRRCELSLVEFIKAAWHVIEPGQPYVHSWHVEFIAAHLTAISDGTQFEDGSYYNRLLINIPPGFSKSLILNVFFPAWEWGPRNMPHLRYVCVSHAQHLSIRDSIKMRRLVMSDWYQGHWGDRVQLVKDQNQTIKFETTATGFRQSAAAGSVTGARGDRFFIDDPLSVEDAMSATILESRKNWFLEAVPTRLNNPDKSAIVVIMQRLSELDTSGIILDNDMGYDAIVLPMRYEAARNFETKLGYTDPRTEEGELLFPERFPEHVVEQLEASLGVYGTAGQLQQIPVPRGGGIIKPSWWQLWEEEHYPQMEYVLLALDTAYTDKQENDPSGFIIWGVFSQRTDTNATRITDRYGRTIEDTTQKYGSELGPTPKVMMMYAWTDHLEFHELVQHVAKTAKKYGVDEILIENKATGHSVAQELRRLFYNEDFAVRLIDPKGIDKVGRLHAVQHFFEEGMVYAPDKDWAEVAIRQISSFPKGKHDEFADVTAHGLKSLRDRGFLTRAPERMRSIEEASRFRGNTGNGPLYDT